MYDDGYCSMGPGDCFYLYISSDVDVGTCLFLGRAPCTKETLPDFRERGRVTRPSRVFPSQFQSLFTKFFRKINEIKFFFVKNKIK